MGKEADTADALGLLGERIDGLASRMDRMENRVLKWGTALIVGLEGLRLFLAPLVATLGAVAVLFLAGCSPAQRTVAVETACQAAHTVVHHICDVRTAGGEGER